MSVPKRVGAADLVKVSSLPKCCRRSERMAQSREFSKCTHACKFSLYAVASSTLLPRPPLLLLLLLVIFASNHARSTHHEICCTSCNSIIARNGWLARRPLLGRTDIRTYVERLQLLAQSMLRDACFFSCERRIAVHIGGQQGHSWPTKWNWVLIN